MADINALIATGARPVEYDPFSQLAKLQQLDIGAAKAQELQNALAERTAITNRMKQPGFNMLDPEQQRQMMVEAPLTAPKYIESALTTQESMGKILDTKLKQSRSFLEGVRTPEEYLAWHEANHRDSVLGPVLAARGITADQSRGRIMAALQQPGGLQQLINESKLGIEKFAEMSKPVVVSSKGALVDPQSGRVIYKGSGSGGGEGNYGGVGANGAPIRLTKKDFEKREMEYPKATAAISSIEAKSDRFVADIEKLANHPGLSEITGVVAGRLPGLSKEGREAQALYDKITAKGGFQALQDMREASKTGGALGNVSNQEGKQLISSFAAIDRRQDADSVREALRQAAADVQGAKTRMRDAYDMTYEYRAPREQKAPTPPSGAGNIPAGAIEMLRKNPGLKADFEAKYGVGSAAKALR